MKVTIICTKLGSLMITLAIPTSTSLLLLAPGRLLATGMLVASVRVSNERHQVRRDTFGRLKEKQFNLR